MTSPRHAFEADDKGRYYRHPLTGEHLISVTNALSVGFAKYGLPRWYANCAADHVLDNLPQIVARSRSDRDGVREEIATAGDRARDLAADIGTRTHDLAEAHLLGRSLAPEPELDRYAEVFVAQYLKFLKDFGVQFERDVVATEMTVAHPALST